MKAADGPTLEEKACSKCKVVKPRRDFCINKYMADGMQVREKLGNNRGNSVNYPLTIGRS